MKTSSRDRQHRPRVINSMKFLAITSALCTKPTLTTQVHEHNTTQKNWEYGPPAAEHTQFLRVAHSLQDEGGMITITIRPAKDTTRPWANISRSRRSFDFYIPFLSYNVKFTVGISFLQRKVRGVEILFFFDSEIRRRPTKEKTRSIERKREREREVWNKMNVSLGWNWGERKFARVWIGSA